MTRISFKHMVLSGLLAGVAATAMAQPAPVAPAEAPMAQPTKPAERAAHPHGLRHDPAKFQAKMAERQAALKSQLKITAEQEPAWNVYTASRLPLAGKGPRPDREALRSMTTPERIEQMRKHQAERQAEMDRRADATLRLYAALSPEQQKLFDARTGLHDGGGRPGHGPHGPRHAPAKG